MKSKKIIVCALVIIVLLLAPILWNTYKSEKNSNMEHYCYTINQQIKDLDFSYAEISNGTILLYTSADLLIEEIPFKEFDHRLDILSIRKENDSISFVLGGSVDDEVGIMFMNGSSNANLDGINSLERIGGNSYRYDTAQ